jgi:ribonuclease BN (tRNA processing enzyme)
VGFPSTQGFGHSTINMACDVVAAAEVERLVLFHHDPSYDDARLAANESIARSRFEAATAAHEGLKIMLQDKNRSSIPKSPAHTSEVQYAKNG